MIALPAVNEFGLAITDLSRHREVISAEVTDRFIDALEASLPSMEAAPFPRGNAGYLNGDVITIPLDEDSAANLEIVLPEHWLQHVKLRLISFDFSLILETSQVGKFQCGVFHFDETGNNPDVLLDDHGRICGHQNEKYNGVPYLYNAICTILNRGT